MTEVSCPRCGHPNPKDARFCRNCGASMTVSTAKVDIAKVLDAAQRGREHAEERARTLEAELNAERQRGAGAVEEREALAAKLSAAELRLRDLEQHPAAPHPGPAAPQPGKVPEARPTPRRRWWPAALGAAIVLLLGGLGAWEGVRGRRARAEATRQTASARAELDASRVRESQLREEMAGLVRGGSGDAPPGTPTGVDPGAGNGPRARAEQLVARRAEEVAARERAVEDGFKRLEREAAQLAGERRTLTAAQERLERERAAAGQASAARGPIISSAASGFLAWQGEVKTPATIVVSERGPTLGTIIGSLPGRECRVQERRGSNASVNLTPNGRAAHITVPQPGYANAVLVWSCG